MGGTGGGNAIVAAAVASHMRCVRAQSVGADWLRRTCREYERVGYRRRVEANRLRCVVEGGDERVDPHKEIMVATPERERLHPKKDVDSRIEPGFYLRSADGIMRYRPVELRPQAHTRGRCC
jgi:hypothetical protein